MVKRRYKIPKETFDNYILRGVTRKYPSVECLTAQELKLLDSRVRRLMDFEHKARIPFQVINYLSKWLSARSNFSEKKIDETDISSQKRKYFFRDPWEASSMIVVKEGQSPITEGFNLIVCHSDSPCLKLKPRPVKLEWDEDEIYNYLGVRLSAVSYGGSSVHHWIGQQVLVTGYFLDKKGKKIPIEIPGVIGDYAAHVDYRREEEVKIAFPKEKSLEIIVGYTNLKETLKRFEFESLDDFSETKLFAVPTNPPLPIDEYTWRLLVGYGHDDKVCTFAAIDAIIKAKNPKKTAIIWITDKEEVGDNSPTGASGPFLDLVLDNLIDRAEHKNGIEISERLRRAILHKASLLIGDVNIAPYGYDSDEMDVKNAPKIGFGVYILSDEKETSNNYFIKKLRNLSKRGQSVERNICYQICGDIYHQDKEENFYRGYGDGKDNLMWKIGQWAWVGVPCASTHSHNEIICPADEMWTSKLYRRFLESELGLK